MVPLGAVKGQTHGMNSMNTRNLLVFWGGGGAFAYFQAAFGSFEPLLPPLWTLFFQFFGHHTAAWGGGVMLFCFLLLVSLVVCLLIDHTQLFMLRNVHSSRDTVCTCVATKIPLSNASLISHWHETSWRMCLGVLGISMLFLVVLVNVLPQLCPSRSSSDARRCDSAILVCLLFAWSSLLSCVCSG